MLRSMVIIGAISTWLWLTRTTAFWIVCGTPVLLLMLHAANRRSRLAREPKAEGERPTPLSRAGVVGYSLAVLLGLAWVASVLVWDAYEHERRAEEQRRWGVRPSILTDIPVFFERISRPSAPARPGPIPAPKVPIRVKPNSP